jgi:hypothetical protein
MPLTLRPNQDNILQVVRHEWVSEFTTTSAAWVAVTGANKVVTPKSSTSMFIILADIHLETLSTITTAGTALALTKDAVQLHTPSPAEYYYQQPAAGTNRHRCSIPLSDSFASTSLVPITIGLDGVVYTGTLTVNIGNSFKSSLTIIEVEQQ